MRVRWKTRPYSQPGLGVALWAATVWLLVLTFRATVVVAKWTAVLVVTAVAFIVGWVADHRRQS